MDVRKKLVEIVKKAAYSSLPSNTEDFHLNMFVTNLLSHGVTVQEWISVTERLPDNKEHDWVLPQVVEDNGFMHIPKVMEYRQSKNDWFEETYGWISEHNGAFTVTHWMPLPSPPMLPWHRRRGHRLDAFRLRTRRRSRVVASGHFYARTLRRPL